MERIICEHLQSTLRHPSNMSSSTFSPPQTPSSPGGGHAASQKKTKRSPASRRRQRNRQADRPSAPSGSPPNQRRVRSHSQERAQRRRASQGSAANTATSPSHRNAGGLSSSSRSPRDRRDISPRSSTEKQSRNSSTPQTSTRSGETHHGSHRSSGHPHTRRRAKRHRHETSSSDDDDSCSSDVSNSHHTSHREAHRPRIEGKGPPINSSAKEERLSPPSTAAVATHIFDTKLRELLYCLSPTSEEREKKIRVIEDIRATMRRTGIDVQIYGSLCTGLVIPASDIDCVLMCSSDTQAIKAMSATLLSAMKNIASVSATGSALPRHVRASLSTAIRTSADRMRQSPKFTRVTAIAHAKVPIVKCWHRHEDLKVDLSFEQDGCVSSNYLCELFCEPGNEMARPLIVLVKALMNHSHLDDPSVGGLGSFPISMLVLWYLQECVRQRFPLELRTNMAVLLTGFVKYYGDEFDFRHLGIDFARQRTFSKAAANDLYIVNPIHPGVNCAKAATLFAGKVVPLFQRAAATFAELLDKAASPEAIETRILQFFSKALPGVRGWCDVTRQVALRQTHLPQNMWDTQTNMYVGGVL